MCYFNGKTIKRYSDNCWHPIKTEMPNMSSDVQVKDKDGNIYNREIIVEMSGYYLYRRELPSDWESFSDYVEWRFDHRNQIQESEEFLKSYIPDI